MERDQIEHLQEKTALKRLALLAIKKHAKEIIILKEEIEVICKRAAQIV